MGGGVSRPEFGKSGLKMKIAYWYEKEKEKARESLVPDWSDNDKF